MIVRTKNYKLEKKIYINTALKAILKKQGWIAAAVRVVTLSVLFYSWSRIYLVVYWRCDRTRTLCPLLVDPILRCYTT